MAKAATLKPFIRSWEGGFANVKGDRGGATKWGVTIGTFRMVYGKYKTVDDLKAMTEEQWNHIFKVYFWDKWRADEITSQSVANILVDWVWASGAGTIKKIQKLLGVAVDGVVGRKTLEALNGYPDGQHILFNRIKAQRTAYINAIATGTQQKFKKGWTRRLSGIQYGSLVYNDGTTVINK